jgi:hypothetical protein
MKDNEPNLLEEDELKEIPGLDTELDFKGYVYCKLKKFSKFLYTGVVFLLR